MIFSRKNKTERKRPVLSFSLQVIIFLMLFWLLSSWTQRDMITGSAPDIIATDLQGEQVSLVDFRGEPVLLYFWASWCRICDFSEGAVDSVASNWPVLTVAMQSGDQQEVANFLKSQGVQWRTITDARGELAKRFGVSGVPAYYIIDANGHIRFTERGYTTSWGLRARLLFTKIFYPQKSDESLAIYR